MKRLRANSLAVRLTGTLVAALAALLLFSWFVALTLQKRFAETTARYSALALSETLTGGLHGMMLANDREALNTSVRAISKGSPNIRVRVFNKEGTIVYSSIPAEAGQRVDTTSEACFKCHAAGQPDREAAARRPDAHLHARRRPGPRRHPPHRERAVLLDGRVPRPPAREAPPRRRRRLDPARRARRRSAARRRRSWPPPASRRCSSSPSSSCSS